MMKPSKLVERVQGLRQSGAAGTHSDRRTKRLRTRTAKKFTAIKESKDD